MMDVDELTPEILAKMIAAAMEEQDDARHGSMQAYLDFDDLADVTIDGHLDLTDVARRLWRELERRKALLSIHPDNRALQLQVWAAEDADVKPVDIG